MNKVIMDGLNEGDRVQLVKWCGLREDWEGLDRALSSAVPLVCLSCPRRRPAHVVAKFTSLTREPFPPVHVRGRDGGCKCPET